MRLVFWRKEEEAAEKALPIGPKNLLDVLDGSSTFISKLGAGGGFGYALFGGGFALILIVTLVLAKIAKDLVPSFFWLASAMLAAGTVVAIVDRVAAYKLGMLKMRMITSVTKSVVDTAMRQNIDSSKVRAIVAESLSTVWCLWIPADFNKTKDALPPGA